jgi:hypothetical protein
MQGRALPPEAHNIRTVLYSTSTEDSIQSENHPWGPPLSLSSPGTSQVSREDYRYPRANEDTNIDFWALELTLEPLTRDPFPGSGAKGRQRSSHG